MKVIVDTTLVEKSSGMITHAFKVVGGGFEASIVYTSRSGGFSQKQYSSLNLSFYVGDEKETVKKNRKSLSQLLGFSDFITVNQVHGNHVEVIDKINSASVKSGHIEVQADALVTAQENVPLGVLAADCLPIIIVAEPGIAAAVHAGWRGIFEGILERAVYEIKRLKAKDFAVFFGPSICRNCYEVSEEVTEKFRKKFKGGVFNIKGNWHLCLKSLAFEVLEKMDVARRMVSAGQLSPLGLTGSKIVYNIDVCTFENKIYYSYRRDGLTGRQAGIVLLRRREF